MPAGLVMNNSASLIYREKVQDERASFILCYHAPGANTGRALNEGWGQYGVKIYGPGHNYRSDQWAASNQKTNMHNNDFHKPSYNANIIIIFVSHFNNIQSIQLISQIFMQS